MIMALRNGANYHYCARDKSTLLSNLVQMYHPLTTQDIIRHWLIILQSHGVNTGQYLRCEVELYMAHRGESREEGHIRRRKIDLFGQRDDAVSVAWEGCFPGPCQQVLEEFVSFGDDRCFSSSLIYLVIRERDWSDFGLIRGILFRTVNDAGLLSQSAPGSNGEGWLTRARR